MVAPTRRAWHRPEHGKVSHYHDRLGVPVCGQGWFEGVALAGRPENACKRCTALAQKELLPAANRIT
jgi:hypothetical protein